MQRKKPIADECATCGRTISLQNMVKHKRACEIKQARKLLPRIRKGHPKGTPAWNSGLSKQTDERVAKNSVSVALVMRAKVASGTYVPRQITEEEKANLSSRMSSHNPGGKCRWYDVGTEKVQGRWERDLALKMNELQIAWTKRNQDRISYTDDTGKVRNYTPDFFLSELNLFLEIKGFWWGDDRTKMKQIASQHPQVVIVIVERALFQNLLSVTSKQEFFESIHGVVGSASA